MSQTSEFPQQIVIEILSRLPSKSLCRFKCVSKPWLTLISDPYFVKQHLTHHKKQILILQKSQSMSLISVDFEESSDDDNSVIPTELDFQPANFVEVLGSCNGLLLLLDKQKSLVLLNPSIKLFKKLPLPSSSPDFLSDLVMYGFGYDSATDDCKVVKITHYERKPDNDEDIDGNDEDIDGFILPSITVGVYSVKFGTWRVSTYDPSLEICRILPGALCALVNGSIHWWALSGDGSYVIAAFDLTLERFINNVMLPSSLDCIDESFIYEISAVGGCLCLYNRLSTCGPSYFWVMKEYGKFESWTRFSIFHPNDTLIKNLFLLSDGCFLVQLLGVANWIMMEDVGYKWLIFNKEGQMAREFVVNSVSRRCRANFCHVEILVSPIPANFIRLRNDRFGQTTNAREVFASSLKLIEETLQESKPEATINEERTYLFQPTSGINNVDWITLATDHLDPPTFLDS